MRARTTFPPPYTCCINRNSTPLLETTHLSIVCMYVCMYVCTYRNTASIILCIGLNKKMSVWVSRHVNGVDDHSIVTWRDGNKGEWPSHQFVVVLHDEVLWSHLQHRYVRVLGV